MDRHDSSITGVVEPHLTTLELPEGGFRLEDGDVLPQIDVAWESCGLETPANDNVIFICHALTGDAHVAGMRPGETESSGWARPSTRTAIVSSARTSWADARELPDLLR